MIDFNWLNLVVRRRRFNAALAFRLLDATADLTQMRRCLDKLLRQNRLALLIYTASVDKADGRVLEIRTRAITAQFAVARMYAAADGANLQCTTCRTASVVELRDVLFVTVVREDKTVVLVVAQEREGIHIRAALLVPLY